MSADRRDFLKLAGGAAGAWAAGSLARVAAQNAGRPRVVVLWEEGFPAIDGLNLERATLETALGGFDLAFWNVQQFTERIEKDPPDLFVNPYGAAFPARAWYPLHQYLWPGRNWLNLGGVPLAAPCAKSGAGWRAEARQPQYHKRFGIYQSFTITREKARNWLPAESGPVENLKGFEADESYELYLRFTTTNDYPNETGTAGQRDAKVTALVKGYDSERCVAAPVLQVDRMLGDYAGGRWVWANYKGRISAELIKTLAETALQGAIEVTARPTFACYREGETPTINVQVRRPKGGLEQLAPDACRVEFRDAAGRLLSSQSVPMVGQGLVATGGITIAGAASAAVLATGLYQIVTTVKLGATEAKHNTGFWVYDAKLMSAGAPLTADKHFLYRNGEPFPVTGTTYMASDVHRKFLLEPNPFVWDRDFAEMKRAGVNMVRTGLWTAWKNYMLDVGAVNEAFLRSLDAFMLTARKYDMPVIFTFFAFLPEMWGGQNAYLDPRAARAQKQFLSIVAQRYGAMNDVIWDLINEPSFNNPDRLWSCRPNYDAFERQAWRDWLKERYPSESEEDLLEKWRATPEDGTGLPKLEEFDNMNIADTRRPLKTIDYRLFAQDMFIRWVDEMRGALRSNGNAQQLITVGQDEAGAGDSPNPQFHDKTVDFTCLHNWWANDDLVWSGLVTKAPNKPNLAQETGLMFYEKLDGRPWRNQTVNAALLERKMALSVGANGAGFIEWIWNINPYMTLDNEAAIGFHYLSGAVKPELEAFVKIARFAAANRKWFKDKQDEEVVLVLPHSHAFTPRNHFTEATRRAVRAMHYHCQTPMRAVGEYQLRELTTRPKLLLVPSPQTLAQSCWDALLAHADKGATVVLTGPFDLDEHYLPVDTRLKTFNWNAERAPVMPSEFLALGNGEQHFRYGGEKMQRLEKAVADGEPTARVRIAPRGAGKFVWCPLPVEASDTNEPVAEFYRAALAQAGVAPLFAVTGANPSLLIRPTLFAGAVLYTFVNESERDANLQVTHTATKTPFTVKLAAQRAAFALLDRPTGRLLATTE
jgi:hypothetical protein